MKKKFIAVASLAFVAALSAGFAVANVTANAAETKADFAITATSVRYDDPAKEGVDSGLRFKIDVPVGATVTDAYTTITVTPVGKESVSTKVEATVWRPAELNEGYGWNTVLLDIPSTDYGTVVTAKAYATIDGVARETAEVCSSIAQTASLVMNQDNKVTETLNAYVTGNVSSVTMNTATATLNEAGATLQLSATTDPAGFGVVWTTSNKKIATVDNTGKVTAVSGGVATITAQMGGKSTACEVTVNAPKNPNLENFNNQDADDFFVNFLRPYYSIFKAGDVVTEVDGLVPGKEVSISYQAGYKLKDGTENDYYRYIQLGTTTKHMFGTRLSFLDAIFADPDVESFSYDFLYVVRDGVTCNTVTFRPKNAANPTVTPFTSGEWTTQTYTRTMYEAWCAVRTAGTWDATYGSNGSESLTLSCTASATTSVVLGVDNLRVTYKTEDDGAYKTAYDFEDGNNPGVFYMDGGNIGIQEYKDSNALVMYKANGSYITFNISADYLAWAFADESVQAVSFDMTIECEPLTTGESTDNQVPLTARCGTTVVGRPRFVIGETQTVTITREHYESTPGAGELKWNNTTNPQRALTWYIDNIQAD